MRERSEGKKQCVLSAQRLREQAGGQFAKPRWSTRLAGLLAPPWGERILRRVGAMGCTFFGSWVEAG